MLKTYHFSIILWYYAIIYALEIIYIHYIWIAEILYHEVPLHVSCQLWVQWHHVISLKLIMVKIFTPQKSAYGRNQGSIYCFVDYLDFRKWWKR